MLGLEPRIHTPRHDVAYGMDARVKPEHDGGEGEERRRGRRASPLRQGHEFLLVPRNDVEPAGPPLLLGHLDAVLRGRNEVPPEFAFRVKATATEKHKGAPGPNR